MFNPDDILNEQFNKFVNIKERERRNKGKYPWLQQDD